jgi:hypothetical protein
MDVSTQTVLIGIVVMIVVALGVRLWILERRLRVFLEGKDAKSLENVLALVCKEVMSMRGVLQELDSRMTEARDRLHGSVQHVGIIRFNPFQDAGGDQSFCIALLDEAHNGVVVSSLYARDGVRVYGKPVLAGASTYTLSQEEQGAIKKAIKEA